MNGASPVAVKSARQIFGEIVKRIREHKNHSHRRVADFVGVSQNDVASWEAGTTAPTNKQWQSLRHMSRQLNYYNQQYQAARAEDERERGQITGALVNGANNHRATVATNIGDRMPANVHALVQPKAPTTTPPAQPAPPKPALAIVAPVSAPDVATSAPVPETPMPPTSRPRPGRARTAAADVVQRREFARNIFRQRPAIKIGGPDGILELIRERFGVGVEPDALEKIRQEVLVERGASSPTVAAPMPTVAIAAKPSPVAPPPAKDRDATNEAINTAVSLVIDAIPGLRTFTIDVDASGKATINVVLAEVVVTERKVSFEVGGKS